MILFFLIGGLLAYFVHADNVLRVMISTTVLVHVEGMYLSCPISGQEPKFSDFAQNGQFLPQNNLCQISLF